MAVMIQLDLVTEMRLADEAKARGVTLEAVAREVLESWFEVDDPHP